jgi:uncharacterized protein (TIGR03118 family)
MPTGATGTSAPTGQVFNGTIAFKVTANGKTAPAQFLFATEDGTISGWNSTVDATHAVLAVDNFGLGSVFKGLTSGTSGNKTYLYAADFHSRRVLAFDSNFVPAKLAGAFTDSRIPLNFAPFGIANINGKIYVSYAKQDVNRHDDVAGLGNGFVDVFNTNGTLAQRLISRGQLDSPWGMVRAPSSFGPFANDLLVGNFGNGRINIYNPNSGQFVGTLHTSAKTTMSIDGLWGLRFGNGGAAGPTTTLFFTAGPNSEANGLFGSIAFSGTATSPPPTTNPTPPPPMQQPTPTPPSSPVLGGGGGGMLGGDNGGFLL